MASFVPALTSVSSAGSSGQETQGATTPLPTPFYSDIAKGIKVSKYGKLLQQFLEEVPPTASLINAYNNWVQNVIPRQISDKSTMVGNYLVHFGPTLITPPMYSVDDKPMPLTPALALLEKRTYEAEIKVHISIIEGGSLDDPCAGRVISQTDVPYAIGKIPCMILCKLCHLSGKSSAEIMAMGSDPRDPGGYFIVNGIERAMFYTEKLRVNRFLVNSDPKTLDEKCSITADTIKGTLVTEMRALRMKDRKSLHLTLNVRRETTESKRTFHSINVFQGIRLYIRLKALQENMGDLLRYQDPYELEHLILSFVKEENRSDVQNVLADSILDALIDDKEYEELIPLFTRNIIPVPSDEEIRSKMFHALESSLLSHVDSRNTQEKIYTACMMVAILSEYTAGVREPSNKDSWTNKRLATASKWCEQLFRGLWKNFVRDRLAPFSKKENPDKLMLESIIGSIKGDPINEQFRTSFTSTIWGVGTINVKMRNPVQILQQSSFMMKLSSLNRIDVNIDRKTKNPNVRSIQADQWGGVCPGETTESDAVGIVKSKAVTAQITLPQDMSSVVDILRGEILISVNDNVKTGGYVSFSKISAVESLRKEIVLVNGTFQGWCNGKETRRVLIEARRQNQIDRQTAIVLDENGYLNVHTDEGRIVRPLLIVDADGDLVIDKKKMWHLVEDVSFEIQEDKTRRSSSNIQALFNEGCIEWIDLYEQVYLRIAVLPEALQQWKDKISKLRRKIDEVSISGEKSSYLKYYQNELAVELASPYTHVEIHPQAQYGVSLSIMPFLGYNQAPRVVYQSQMGKQALGTAHLNHPNRFDNDTKVMTHASRPLVTQQLEDVFKMGEFSQGTHLQVLFRDDIDNQEDAFIINENVVKLGYLSTAHYILIEVKIVDGKEVLIKPEAPKTGEDYSRYQFLTPQGLPMIGAPLNTGDYVVGKMKFTDKFTDKGQQIFRNSSRILKHGEYGIVDKVYVSKKNLEIHIKITIRRDRYHQIGDKLSSRFAQKGTTSRKRPAHLMPFDEKTGEIPDMIVNPTSTPKRMTMGYILEPLFGIIAAMTGHRFNASPFESIDIDEAYKVMSSFGFDPQGYRWMVDPSSGMRFKGMVFMGPVYIQILHHFGPEKLQVRSSGVVKQLTRQPPRGTAVGGRRSGEMERDAMISHGATNVLVERMMTMSDAYKIPFCKTCGNYAEVHPMSEREKLVCSKCKDQAEFVKTTIPYVYKLFVQYMFGAGIHINFDFNKTSQEVDVPELEDACVPDDDGDDDDDDDALVSPDEVEQQESVVPEYQTGEGISTMDEDIEDDFQGQEAADDWDQGGWGGDSDVEM